MAERKTQENTASVKDFLNNVKNARRRKDSLFVWKMMEAISGKKAKMWGPSIVGFDKHRYKYKSGISTGGCLYINKLEDVDLDVLKDIIDRAYQFSKEQT